MRIVFCGTPEYAVPSLKALVALAPEHEMVGVVSQPDKPKGRSGTPTPPPVVTAARELGISNDVILQPRSINKTEVLVKLRAMQPDVLCVIAYGGLLKKDALEIARLYPINAHASLLPKYRGAAPIQAALLSGDPETGVCIMKMELGLDTGPVMLRKTLPIKADDDAGTLHDKLAAMSADCFVEAIKQIAAGNVSFTPQDDSQSSYAPKLEKNSGKINWNTDAVVLERFIRAMNPWPGAWTSVSAPDGSTVRLRVAKAALSESSALAGEGKMIGAAEKAMFEVAAASKGLLISHVQPEGKRVMTTAEFLRGGGRKLTGSSRWS